MVQQAVIEFSEGFNRLQIMATPKKSYKTIMSG